MSVIVNDNRPTGQVPNSAVVTVDGSKLQNVKFSEFGESNQPTTFVFVVDTTTTAYADQKNRPVEIANDIYSARKGKNDDYFLISFDTEVHAPVGPSKYPDDVLNTLSYNNAGMSDYSEALMKAVDLLKKETRFSKKVIILISDGYQVSIPKRTHGELLEEFRNYTYPVYTCGLLQSQAGQYIQTDLDKLRDISEQTGGLFFSYDTNKTPGKDILSHISKSCYITGTMPGEYSRLSSGKVTMNISLKRSDRDIISFNSNVTLPMIKSTIKPTSAPTAVKPTAAPTAVKPTAAPTAVKPTAVPTAVPTEVPTPGTCKDPNGFTGKLACWMQEHLGNNWKLIAGGGCALIILLIVLLIVNGAKRKKKKNPVEPVNPAPVIPEQPVNPDPVKPEPPVNPEPVKPEPPVRNMTKIVFDDLASRGRYKAVIPDGGHQIFGKIDNPASGVVGLGGDSHISRKHFMISVNGDMVVIEDLGSTNGTWLNGDRIRGQVVIHSGSKVYIGDRSDKLEFGVTITKI